MRLGQLCFNDVSGLTREVRVRSPLPQRTGKLDNVEKQATQVVLKGALREAICFS